jgi:DNA polymerase-4
MITYKNIRNIYSKIGLRDLCGINTQFEARLNVNGIYTPLDFFNAPLYILTKKVFKSVCGYYWYLRLRGWEIDNFELKRKSYGQSYALPKPTKDPSEISRLLMKLCEKMGRRLRAEGYYAMGIHVSCLYNDRTHWHKGGLAKKQLYSTKDLFERAQALLNKQPEKKKISNLAVSCYDVLPYNAIQLQLFGNNEKKSRDLSDSLDKINDKYGEYTIYPLIMKEMNDIIIDRIAFGTAPKGSYP